MTIEAQVQDFIRSEIAYDQQIEPLQPDQPLLDAILDSVDTFRLVIFLEEEFRIWVEDAELIPENFATIDSIARFVRAKMRAS